MPIQQNTTPVPFRLGYSVDEFCEAFGMGRTLFYKMKKEGKIQVVKAGRRTLIPVAEMTAWLNRCASQPLIDRAS